MNPTALFLDEQGARNLANLAKGLGLIPDGTLRAVKKLAAIRDEFAHQLDRELTAAEVNAFVALIPARIADSYGRRLAIAAGERGEDGMLDHHLQIRVAIQGLRTELNFCAWNNFFLRNPAVFEPAQGAHDGAAG